MKRNVSLMILFVLLFTALVPFQAVSAGTNEIQTLGDQPVAWPRAFTAYTDGTGNAIYDPTGIEPGVSPDDVDISSGIDKGTGKLPSVYVASDENGANFFVRLRLKGDPYDRKGGFLSSVWLVQLAVNGVHTATIGVNGKSPHVDYVYIANADGTTVQPIYATTVSGGNEVPGTDITAAENGHYFLDFQVPIQRISNITNNAITGTTPIQLLFASSKAGNLSVINKDGINDTSFNGLDEIVMASVPPTIEIDGGSRKEYVVTTDPASKTVTGSTSLKTGSVNVSIDGDVPVTAAVTDYRWSYVLPTLVSSQNGTYVIEANVTSGGKTALAVQEATIKAGASTAQITIAGGATAVTTSSSLTFAGTAAGGSNAKVQLEIDGSLKEGGISIDNSKRWTSGTIALTNPTDGKVYTVVARYTDAADKNTFATVTQKLTYKAPADNGNPPPPVTVGIGTVSGGALPTIPGTSTGADEVEVLIDGVTVAVETVTPANGAWSVTLEQPLSAATHTIEAIATNSYGSSATATAEYTVSTTSISIDNGAAVVTNDNEPTINGSTNAPNGSTITVTIGNRAPLATTAQNGRWRAEVPLGQPLDDGDYPVVAATINSATANQTLTVDTETAVTILEPADGSVTNDTTPLIYGTAESGATIVLNINDGESVEAVTADGNGAWSFQPNTPLDLGAYTVVATASDIYGNEAETSSAFTISHAPVLTNTSPADNSTDVELTGNLGLTFNKGVIAVAGKSLHLHKADGTLVESIIVTSGQVTLDGAQLAIDPTEDLESETAYYVLIDAGAFEDMDHNAYAGLADVGGWSFTTVSAAANAGVEGTVTSATGGSVEGIAVKVKNVDGFLKQATTDQDGYYTISGLPDNEVTVYVENSKEILIASNPIQLVNGEVEEVNLTFRDIAAISLTADPSSLVGDGASTSLLTAVVTYKDGSGTVANLPVRFTAADGTLSNETVATDETGTANSTLTAPVIQGIEAVTKPAEIIVRDLELGIFAEKTLAITFVPAVIEGIVTVNGQPVAGATVTIREDLGPPIGIYEIMVTTGVDGRYSLIVPLGNRTYTLNISATIQVDGQPVTVNFDQVAEVGSTGQGQVVPATRQISGQLFVKGNLDKDISQILGSHDAVTGKIYDADGSLLDKTVTIDSQGRYKVEDLQTGTYRILFQLTAPNGEKLAGIWLTVTVADDGEIAIEIGLIDPYGIITNAVTGEPIQGVDMKLYWADTQLNRDYGRTPHTLVDLPILEPFDPNQNRNPQVTTGIGEYAWMVYADGDYYLTGSRDGHVHYDSRDEARDVPVKPGEDSWITDGIIHVGESIVEYNFSMQPMGAQEGALLLTADTVTETTAELDWNTVTGAVYYNLYRDSSLIATVTDSTYTVTGLTGGTTYQFYVTAANEAGVSEQSNTLSVTTLSMRTGKDMFTYTLPNQIGPSVINAANGTIAVTVGYGTDLSGLIATFTLSEGASATVGGTPQVSEVSVNDYGAVLQYLVTAENGSTKLWTVTVTAETLDKINEDIKDALKQLKVKYQEGDIWESITLPIFLVKDGAHSTVVGWTSNKPDVIDISEVATSEDPSKPKEFLAHVNRQSKDVSVILTATVSKAPGTPLSRTFLLIVKSNTIDQAKVTVDRADSKVKVGGQEVAVDVNRTTLSNGSKIDKLIVSSASMDQLLLTNTDANQLKLTFSDTPGGDVSKRADELAMELPIAALEKLNGTTELDLHTPEGSIRLTPATLAQMKDAGIDLFFRIVPIRDASSQSTISGETKQDPGVIRAAGTGDIRILDIPRKIETNYTGLATDVTLPLTHMTLPTDPDELQAFLDSLRVFIQHSDGTTRVVRGTGPDDIPGTIVYEGGVPVGIRFTLTKFSTFTIFQTVTPAVTLTPPPAPVAVVAPEAPVAVGSSSSQLGEGQIEIVLTRPAAYFDPAAFTVTVGGVEVAVVSVEQVEGKLQIKLAAPVAAGYQVVVKYDPAAAGQSGRVDALPKLEAILMNEVVHHKYMNGYPDGTFRPQGAISRVEVAAMLTRLIGRDQELALPDYADVNPSHWGAPAIQVMRDTRIMLGYGDGSFKPNQSVTRAEFAVILLRFMVYHGQELPEPTGAAFSDTAHHWAGAAISVLKELEVLRGEYGLFHPDRALSRAEAVTAMNKVLGRGGLTGDFAPSWPDAPKYHWAYAQIEEASRSHEATRISPEEELLIRFID